MRYEIAIEGDTAAVDTLARHLGPRLFIPADPKPVAGDTSRLRIHLCGPEPVLHFKLLQLEDLLRAVESRPEIDRTFELRMRNPDDSEPPSGSEEYLSPFAVGADLTLIPWRTSISLPTAPPAPGEIRLDPCHAFGTGKHPTTRLCISLLGDAIADGSSPPGSRLLDIGCGSGLLAIAAVRLGVDRAVGVEIDPSSVRAARRNAELNQLSERIEILHGSLAGISGRFELIAANLVPAVLKKLGPRFRDHLTPAGSCLISGFRAARTDDFAAFFARHGLTVSGRRELGGWGSLLLRYPLQQHHTFG